MGDSENEENSVGQSMSLGKFMECLGSEKHCLVGLCSSCMCGKKMCRKLYGVHIDNGLEWQAKIITL